MATAMAMAMVRVASFVLVGVLRPTHEFYLHEKPGQYHGGDEDMSTENQAFRRSVAKVHTGPATSMRGDMTKWMGEMGHPAAASASS